MTDRRTDGQTDRRTDGQTDGHPESIGPQPLGLGPKNQTLSARKQRIKWAIIKEIAVAYVFQTHL